MAYQPVGGNPGIRGLQPAHLDNIELDTRYDPTAYNNTKYAPPSGLPPDNDSKFDEDDKKPLFRANIKTAQAPGNNWPVAAQRVATLTPLRAGLMVFDAVLASTPLMFVGKFFLQILACFWIRPFYKPKTLIFIALALTAARLDGNEVSGYGDRLEETLLLSPTIFPLIFAALMGRFFRHLGVYLAERGTTLGRLEQLVGCQSVFSALERQVTLRYWSVVGLFSVLVWLLSPVGGQSAHRLPPYAI
jgi:hypothetical protein